MCLSLIGTCAKDPKVKFQTTHQRVALCLNTKFCSGRPPPIQPILSACFFLVLFKRTHALFLRALNSFYARPTLYMRLECDVRRASRVSWLVRGNPNSLPTASSSKQNQNRKIYIGDSIAVPIFALLWLSLQILYQYQKL